MQDPSIKPSKIRHSRLFRAAAIFLCVCVASDGSLFADPSFSAVPLPLQIPGTFSESSSPDSLELPEKWGLVEESHKGSNGKTVIYIQDAHDSLEAQENIAAMIAHFVETEGVRHVFEEGYEGSVPTDAYFDFIEDRALRKDVSYFLLDRLRLGGAEYAHVNRESDFELVGADSFTMHRENVLTYARSAKHQEAVARDLGALESALRRLIEKYFPDELKEWMKLKRRFDDGEFGFLDYAARMQPGKGLYPRLEKLLAAQRDEPASGRRMPSRAGARRSVSSPERSEAGLAAEREPETAGAELLEELDAAGLFREIRNLENDFAGRYLDSKRDRTLFSYFKYVQILKRLNRIRIAPEEYETALEELDRFNTRLLAEFLAAETRSPVVLSKKWETNIADAVEFYRLAHERDRAVEKALNEHAGLVSVLVFGGFHKNRIREILRRKGYSYKILAPAITAASPRHEMYYRRLMASGYHPEEVPENVRRAAVQFHVFRSIAPEKFRPYLLNFLAAAEPDLHARMINAARSELRTVNDAAEGKKAVKKYAQAILSGEGLETAKSALLKYRDRGFKLKVPPSGIVSFLDIGERKKMLQGLPPGTEIELFAKEDVFGDVYLEIKVPGRPDRLFGFVNREKSYLAVRDIPGMKEVKEYAYALLKEDAANLAKAKARLLAYGAEGFSAMTTEFGNLSFPGADRTGGPLVINYPVSQPLKIFPREDYDGGLLLELRNGDDDVRLYKFVKKNNYLEWQYPAGMREIRDYADAFVSGRDTESSKARFLPYREKGFQVRVPPGGVLTFPKISARSWTTMMIPGDTVVTIFPREDGEGIYLEIRVSESEIRYYDFVKNPRYLAPRREPGLHEIYDYAKALKTQKEEPAARARLLAHREDGIKIKSGIAGTITLPRMGTKAAAIGSLLPETDYIFYPQDDIHGEIYMEMRGPEEDVRYFRIVDKENYLEARLGAGFEEIKNYVASARRKKGRARARERLLKYQEAGIPVQVGNLDKFSLPRVMKAQATLQHLPPNTEIRLHPTEDINHQIYMRIAIPEQEDRYFGFSLGNRYLVRRSAPGLHEVARYARALAEGKGEEQALARLMAYGEKGFPVKATAKGRFMFPTVTDHGVAISDLPPKAVITVYPRTDEEGRTYLEIVIPGKDKRYFEFTKEAAALLRSRKARTPASSAGEKAGDEIKGYLQKRAPPGTNAGLQALLAYAAGLKDGKIGKETTEALLKFEEEGFGIKSTPGGLFTFPRTPGSGKHPTLAGLPAQTGLTVIPRKDPHGEIYIEVRIPEESSRYFSVVTDENYLKSRFAPGKQEIRDYAAARLSGKNLLEAKTRLLRYAEPGFHLKTEKSGTISMPAVQDRVSTTLQAMPPDTDILFYPRETAGGDVYLEARIPGKEIRFYGFVDKPRYLEIQPQPGLKEIRDYVTALLEDRDTAAALGAILQYGPQGIASKIPEKGKFSFPKVGGKNPGLDKLPPGQTLVMYPRLDKDGDLYLEIRIPGSKTRYYRFVKRPYFIEGRLPPGMKEIEEYGTALWKGTLTPADAARILRYGDEGFEVHINESSMFFFPKLVRDGIKGTPVSFMNIPYAEGAKIFPFADDIGKYVILKLVIPGQEKNIYFTFKKDLRYIEKVAAADDTDAKRKVVEKSGDPDAMRAWLLAQYKRGEDFTAVMDITPLFGTDELEQGLVPEDFPVPGGDVWGPENRGLDQGRNLARVEVEVVREAGEFSVEFTGYQRSELRSESAAEVTESEGRERLREYVRALKSGVDAERAAAGLRPFRAVTNRYGNIPISAAKGMRAAIRLKEYKNQEILVEPLLIDEDAPEKGIYLKLTPPDGDVRYRAIAAPDGGNMIKATKHPAAFTLLSYIAAVAEGGPLGLLAGKLRPFTQRTSKDSDLRFGKVQGRNATIGFRAEGYGDADMVIEPILEDPEDPSQGAYLRITAPDGSVRYRNIVNTRTYFKNRRDEGLEQLLNYIEALEKGTATPQMAAKLQPFSKKTHPNAVLHFGTLHGKRASITLAGYGKQEIQVEPVIDVNSEGMWEVYLQLTMPDGAVSYHSIKLGGSYFELRPNAGIKALRDYLQAVADGAALEEPALSLSAFTKKTNLTGHLHLGMINGEAAVIGLHDYGNEDILVEPQSEAGADGRERIYLKLSAAGGRQTWFHDFKREPNYFEQNQRLSRKHRLKQLYERTDDFTEKMNVTALFSAGELRDGIIPADFPLPGGEVWGEENRDLDQGKDLVKVVAAVSRKDGEFSIEFTALQRSELRAGETAFSEEPVDHLEGKRRIRAYVDALVEGRDLSDAAARLRPFVLMSGKLGRLLLGRQNILIQQKEIPEHVPVTIRPRPADENNPSKGAVLEVEFEVAEKRKKVRKVFRYSFKDTPNHFKLMVPMADGVRELHAYIGAVIDGAELSAPARALKPVEVVMGKSGFLHLHRLRNTNVRISNRNFDEGTIVVLEPAPVDPEDLSKGAYFRLRAKDAKAGTPGAEVYEYRVTKTPNYFELRNKNIKKTMEPKRKADPTPEKMAEAPKTAGFSFPPGTPGLETMFDYLAALTEGRALTEAVKALKPFRKKMGRTGLYLGKKIGEGSSVAMSLSGLPENTEVTVYPVLTDETDPSKDVYFRLETDEPVMIRTTPRQQWYFTYSLETGRFLQMTAPEAQRVIDYIEALIAGKDLGPYALRLKPFKWATSATRTAQLGTIDKNPVRFHSNTLPAGVEIPLTFELVNPENPSEGAYLVAEAGDVLVRFAIEKTPRYFRVVYNSERTPDEAKSIPGVPEVLEYLRAVRDGEDLLEPAKRLKPVSMKVRRGGRIYFGLLDGATVVVTGASVPEGADAVITPVRNDPMDLSKGYFFKIEAGGKVVGYYSAKKEPGHLEPRDEPGKYELLRYAEALQKGEGVEEAMRRLVPFKAKAGHGGFYIGSVGGRNMTLQLRRYSGPEGKEFPLEKGTTAWLNPQWNDPKNWTKGVHVRVTLGAGAHVVFDIKTEGNFSEKRRLASSRRSGPGRERTESAQSRKSASPSSAGGEKQGEGRTGLLPVSVHPGFKEIHDYIRARVEGEDLSVVTGALKTFRVKTGRQGIALGSVNGRTLTSAFQMLPPGIDVEISPEWYEPGDPSKGALLVFRALPTPEQFKAHLEARRNRAAPGETIREEDVQDTLTIYYEFRAEIPYLKQRPAQGRQEMIAFIDAFVLGEDLIETTKALRPFTLRNRSGLHIGNTQRFRKEDEDASRGQQITIGLVSSIPDRGEALITPLWNDPEDPSRGAFFKIEAKDLSGKPRTWYYEPKKTRPFMRYRLAPSNKNVVDYVAALIAGKDLTELTETMEEFEVVTKKAGVHFGSMASKPGGSMDTPVGIQLHGVSEDVPVTVTPILRKEGDPSKGFYFKLEVEGGKTYYYKLRKEPHYTEQRRPPGQQEIIDYTIAWIKGEGVSEAAQYLIPYKDIVPENQSLYVGDLGPKKGGISFSVNALPPGTEVTVMPLLVDKKDPSAGIYVDIAAEGHETIKYGFKKTPGYVRMLSRYADYAEIAAVRSFYAINGDFKVLRDISGMFGEKRLKNGTLPSEFPLPAAEKGWGHLSPRPSLGSGLSRVEVTVERSGGRLTLEFQSYKKNKEETERAYAKSRWLWNEEKEIFESLDPPNPVEEKTAELREAFALRGDFSKNIELTSMLSAWQLENGELPSTFPFPNGKQWTAKRRRSLMLGKDLLQLDVIVERKTGELTLEFSGRRKAGTMNPLTGMPDEEGRSVWKWNKEEEFFELIKDNAAYQKEKLVEALKQIYTLKEDFSVTLPVTILFSEEDLKAGLIPADFPIPGGGFWGEENRSLEEGKNLMRVDLTVTRKGAELDFEFVAYQRSELRAEEPAESGETPEEKKGPEKKVPKKKGRWKFVQNVETGKMELQEKEILEGRRAQKREGRKRTAGDEAIEIFRKFKVLDLAINLSSNPDLMQQALTILLSQKGADITPAELTRLSRALILNLAEGQIPPGTAGYVPGSPIDYLRGLMALQEDVEQLQKYERIVLIRAFIRLAFHEFAKDVEAGKAKLRGALDEANQEGFFGDLIQHVEEELGVGLKFQPDHMETQLLPHQRVGAHAMRQSDKLQEEGIFGFLLEDDTRLGKTIQSYAAIETDWKAAIAVPAGVMDTWEEQYYEHTKNRMPFVPVRGSAAEKRAILEKYADKKGVILLFSIEDLQHRTDEDLELISRGLDVLVIDEAQKIENYSGQDASTSTLQARALHKIKTRRKWVLTASPYTSHPKQLFSLFHLLHTDPETGKVSNDKYATRATFSKLLTNNLIQMRWLYALKARLGLRRTKEEMGIMYSKKREIDPEEEGHYTVTSEQAELTLRIIKNLSEYLKIYNARVKNEEQFSEKSMGVFLKLQFLVWALTEPRMLGEDIPTSFWDSMDAMVQKRLAAGRKGIIFAQNQNMVAAVKKHYEDQGKRVVRIDGTVDGYALDEDGKVIRGYYEDGKLVVDPESERKITAKAYQRHLFQEHPDVDIVVMNVRAGVGLNLNAADWVLYAQPPQNYVEYYQSSDRAIGLNPLAAEGRQKEVEVLQMVPRYPKAFTESLMDTPDRPYVSSGTPGEILYRSVMGDDRRRFNLVMEGIIPDSGVSEERALSRLVHSIHGFMEDPSMARASKKQKRKIEAASLFAPLYQKVRGDRDAEESVLDLVEAYAQVDVHPGAFIKAAVDNPQLDTRDLRRVVELFELSNKQHRLRALASLPHVLKQVWDKKVSVSELVERGPPVLRMLGEASSSLLIPLIHISHAWDVSEDELENLSLNNPGSETVLQMIEKIQEAGFNRYEQFQWMSRFVSALIQITEENNLKFLGFMEHLESILLNGELTLEEKMEFFEELAVLHDADFAEYRKILSMRGDYEALRKAMRGNLETAFLNQFQLPGDAATREKVFMLVRKWGSLRAPVQLMAKLQAADPAVYGEHAGMFRQAMRHILDGTYEEWRNRQGLDSTGHEIEFRKSDPRFWEIFTREERVKLGPVTASQKDFSVVRDRTIADLRAALEDPETLRIAFADLAPLIEADLKDPESAKRLQDEGTELGTQRQALVDKNKDKSPDAAISAFDEPLRRLRIRWSAAELYRLLGLSGGFKLEDFKQFLPALKHLQRTFTARKNYQAGELKIDSMIADLLDNIGQIGSPRKFEDVEIEITADPDLIMRRGMLEEEMKNCFNLTCNVLQIATLVDDLAARNKMLAVVRVNGRIASVSILKMRQTEKGDPVIMIERPLYRWGYDFEREVAQAVAITKQPEMPDTAVAGDWYKGEKKKEEIELFTTGARAPTEYHETLFGWRPRASQVKHKAGVIYPALRGRTEKDEAEDGITRVRVNLDGEQRQLLGIGHSSRSIGEFIVLAKAAGVRKIIDVRTRPVSQYYAHFNKAAFETMLAAHGIEYAWLGDLLGGKLPAFKDDFAAYMNADPEGNFTRGIEQLVKELKALERDEAGSVLCSEGAASDCHRRFILDYMRGRYGTGESAKPEGQLELKFDQDETEGEKPEGKRSELRSAPALEALVPGFEASAVYPSGIFDARPAAADGSKGLEPLENLPGDIILGFEKSHLDLLESEEWLILLALKTLNPERLHLLIVEDDTGSSSRFEELQKFEHVYSERQLAQLPRGAFMIFFGDRRESEHVSSRLGAELIRRIGDRYFASGPGMSGVALRYAAADGNLPGLEEVGGYKYDSRGLYASEIVRLMFESYEIVSMSA